MLGLVHADPEFRDAFMPEHLDLRSKLAHEDIYDIARGETLVQPFDRLQYFYRTILRLYSFSGMQAVIAVAAVLGGIFLSEIAHQHLAATDPGLGIAYCLVDELGAHFTFAERFVLHEMLQLGDILMRIIKDTISFQPITARTAGLLVIVLDGFRYVEMDDEPDVRLVDAHPECNSGYDHLHILVEEKILPFRTQLTVQAGMVGHGLDAIGDQHIGQLFRCFPVERIDDTALALVLDNIADNALDGLILFYLWLDLVV